MKEYKMKLKEIKAKDFQILAEALNAIYSELLSIQDKDISRAYRRLEKVEKAINYFRNIKD